MLHEVVSSLELNIEKKKDKFVLSPYPLIEIFKNRLRPASPCQNIKENGSLIVP